MTTEAQQEADGRWIAEVMELPGVLAYGETEAEATTKAEALAAVVMRASDDEIALIYLAAQ